ncbi:MAG: NAD+ synthase [Spirochaetota bacterium]
MKVFIGQMNPIVGDIEGNFNKVISAAREGDAAGADCICTPELCLTGYPPLDLLERRDFLELSDSFISYLKGRLPKERMVIVGAPLREMIHGQERLFSAAYVFHKGAIVDVIKKTLLPTYDVFDESRYFTTNNEKPRVMKFGKERIGITICEDIWNDERFNRKRRYDSDPLEELMKKKPTVIINISASPWEMNKHLYRRELIQHASKRWKTTIVYVNQVGANDSLIFDGGSLVVRNGKILFAAPRFTEASSAFDLVAYVKKPPADLPKIADLMDALTIGIRDYFHKLGFSRAVVGLSGGIDSAVVAVLAVRALGAENVLGVLMPSEFSSGHSVSDARALVKALGIRELTLPIQGPFAAMKDVLRTGVGRSMFTEAEKERAMKDDVTEENLQSRIRGMLLMSLSNKYGYLMLATGNKSEMSTGYATLYGDLCGALAPIGDVLKSDVYALARHINTSMNNVIPENVLVKAPSAELKPDQTDQDTLPPYDVLDDILHLYLEDGKSIEEISKTHKRATVIWVVSTLHKNEYKRRQAPCILKVSRKALRPGRVFPIVQKYHTRF